MIARIFSRGFTLIEVLVVIAIIGILSAVIYANFTDARNDAKNKAIQTALKEVQLALELYKAQNGEYPDAYDVVTDPDCPIHVTLGNPYYMSSTDTCGAVSNPYIDGLIPDFLSELPDDIDSGNTNCNIKYYVGEDNSWYLLLAERCLAGAVDETEGVQPGDEFARCTCACMDADDPEYYESYAVYSAGGECI